MKFNIPKEKWKGETHIFKRESGAEVRVLPFMFDVDARPEIKSAFLQYNAANAAVAEFRAKQEKLKSLNRYTSEGLRAKSAALAFDEEIPALRKAKNANIRLRKSLEDRRDGLKLKEPDRSDVAGEMQRAEIRAYLRSLGIEDRNKILNDPSKEIAEAVIFAPASLSGTTETQATTIRNQELRKRHGDALEEIDNLIGIADNSANAIDAARDQIRLDLGLNHTEFEHLVNPAEKNADAVTVKHFREEVNGEFVDVLRALDAEKGMWRQLSSDELDQYANSPRKSHFKNEIERGKWVNEHGLDAYKKLSD